MPTLPLVTLRQAEALVGLPYHRSTFTCAHLAVLAQERLWGRQVATGVGLRHPVRPRSQAAAMLRWQGEMADPVDGDPSSGDVVLFSDGAPGDEGVQWHIGTVLLEAGQVWVLHTHERLGSSVLQLLSDCRRAGLVLQGFWRLKAAQA